MPGGKQDDLRLSGCGYPGMVAGGAALQRDQWRAMEEVRGDRARDMM